MAGLADVVGDMVFYVVKEVAWNARGDVTDVDIVAGPYKYTPGGQVEAEQARDTLSARSVMARDKAEYRVIATARVEVDAR